MGANERAKIEREMTERFGFVPDFYKAMPEAGVQAAWLEHRDFELAETAIPGKYKELIGLAVAAHIKCRYCVYFHSANARALGAGDEELREACYMGGLTVQFSNSLTGMQTDLDRFRVEVDRAIEHLAAHSGAHAQH